MKRKDSFSFLFAEVVRAHHHSVHSLLAELDLYPGQPRLLCSLWMRDGKTQKELSEETQLRPATISVMLRRMEKAGIVERRGDVEDLRISRVYLTDLGQKLQPEVEARLEALDRKCLENFSLKEQKQLLGFLARIRDNLNYA